jgi:membrane-associated phospholipid phosphatase
VGDVELRRRLAWAVVVLVVALSAALLAVAWDLELLAGALLGSVLLVLVASLLVDVDRWGRAR